jgi:hypothetical protein
MIMVGNSALGAEIRVLKLPFFTLTFYSEKILLSLC